MGKLKLDNRIVRAQFDKEVIRVYQAFSPEIAEPAIYSQKFGAGFKMGRMTWIKPSFCWTLYRSGFATKANQERILAMDIKRSGFEWALENSILSSYNPEIYSKSDWNELLQSVPVRIQWDPERDIRLGKVEGVRAIQIGLSREAVARYANDWVISIHDMTHYAFRAKNETVSSLTQLGINERPYPLPTTVIEKIGASKDQPSSSNFS